MIEPSSPKKGIGSGRAAIVKRAAAAQRTGEADRLDHRMGDERLTHLAIAALDQGKDAGMKIMGLDRRIDRLGDDLAGAGMGAMALDDNRATGRERGRRIAAGRREGEREVRCAEDGDGADRPLDHPQIRARHRLAFGHRLVMASVEIGAFADMLGEQLQLAGRATAFAIESRLGKAGLLSSNLGDLGAALLDLLGDRLQKGGAGLAARITIGPERLFGGPCRLVDKLRRAGGEFACLAGRRLGLEGRAGRFPCPGDEMFAGQVECHG